MRTENNSGGWGRKRSSWAVEGGGEPLRAEALRRMTGRQEVTTQPSDSCWQIYRLHPREVHGLVLLPSF